MKKRFFSRLTALVLTALMPVGVLPIAVWADASDFSYYISTNADGEYAVIDGYYGDGGTVVVPAEIDGLPVLQIAYGVFGSNTEITHVTVSEGILHLSGNVFSWSSVESVSLPSTLTTISSQCFIYSDLTEITIPEGVTLLGSGVFEGCEALTDVYFEAKAPHADWDERWADNCHANIWYDGVLTAECVKDELFLYRVEGKQATVLDYIGDYYAKRAVVPETVGGATVTAIGADAFKDVYYLQEIVLPETVTVIANNAFLSCGSLEKINLPLGLTHIGMQAFMWCGNLQELRIPETVTYIGNNAFYDDYAALYFEASAASDGWEIYWAECFYGSIVWDACVHRDVTVDEVQKTCETDGYRRVTCNDCGEELSYEFFALGHEYVYGVCSVCGHAKDTWDELGYYYDYYYGNDGTETYGIIIGTYYGTEQYVSIPSEIGGVPVIGIGSSAFEGNKTILGVQIPGSVKFIGDWAFANSSLRTAELGEGAEQIRGCAFHNSKLQMINFPSTLTEIGDCAFVETKLYRIEIPESVTYIGNQAFLGCRSLTEIRCGAVSQPEGWHEQWDESLTAEEYFADRLAVMYYTENDTVYRIDIPGYDAAEGVATLYDYNGAEDVVEIPAAVDVWPVVKIGYGAFQYLGVTSVTIPDSVTEIGGSAFSSCDALTEVNIPDSVTAIGSSAFGDCDSLTEITIPASVETMEYAVFRRCESLQNIYCAAATQPETWDEYWIYHCEANVYFDGVMFMGTQDGYLFEIADGGVLIKNYSGGETEIVVPSEISGYPVTEIGDNAFTNRYNVTSIVLPDTLRIIRSFAFADCDALTEITIPASVEVMGSSVFRDCDNLQNIYCETASQPEQWDYYWAGECGANVWFGGVMVQGVIDGFSFRVVDGEAQILDYVVEIPEGETIEIDIPEMLGGAPVTRIGEYAFAYLSGVTGISVPDTVTHFGYEAFSYNDSLTEITIPASVVSMGGWIFRGCSLLTDIYCEEAFRPEGWDYNWAAGWSGNIWFDGVLTQGVLDGFEIRSEDGKAVIYDYVGDATEIVIPSEIGGLPVTVIAEQAFSSLSGVTSITIPDSVENIYYEAFAYNDSLIEITIPASVTFMSGDVFYHCDNLQNIYCEAASEPETWNYDWANGCNASIWFDGVLSIGVIDGFKIRNADGLAEIIDYVGNATEIVIPSELGGMPVAGIGYSAFSDLYEVTSITIPDTVTFIGNNAFACCYELTEITIPESVEYMQRDVFRDCTSLQNIYCEAESRPDVWDYNWANGCDASIWFGGVLTQGVIDGFKFTAENGAIKILDYLGDASEIVIPSELGGMPVTAIASQAFSDCDWITDVTVPDSVVYIGYEAFAYCGGLTEMTIPESVLHMDSDVFWNCENLQNIYCEAVSEPDGWSFDWASACNAAIYFDGVMARGVIGDYRVEFEDGKATILGYLGIESEPVIPAEIDGRPVVAIGYEAFAYNENLIGVTIPASIIRMDSDVFYGCVGLQNIYCESAEEPNDWNYYWTNGCDANVYYNGVLLRGTADGFRFYAEGEGVLITEYFGNESEAVIPAELAGLPVVAIEAYAFAESGFTSVVIPDSVVYIGYEAFAYCRNLTEITIPESVLYMESDVFWGCSSMETVYCEASAQAAEWREGWLGNCRANIYFGGVLTIGTFGDYHADISGDGAVILGYCGEGGGITVPAEIGGKPVTHIGAEAFMGQNITSIVLPETLRVIGSYAFAETALTEITIPASVVLIGSSVFSGCTALRNIYLAPDADIESWPGNWCLYCEADIYRGETQITFRDGDYRIMLLESGVTILDYVGEGGDLVVPETFGGIPVVAIGRGAFDYLDGLTSVVLPDSVVSLGDHAFNGCYNLQSVVLPEKLESIGYSAFCDCASLTEIAIPGTVAYIADEAFAYCRNLTKVFLGNGVLDIGFGAFAGCTALQSIVLPNTLLAISDYAFAETALTEITIPESVEYVGAAVFAMAKSLAVIYCEAEDIGNWEPFWLEGCGAEVVLGVAPCLHETVAEETKAPTCGYGGYLRTVCTDCGTVLEETIFPATGEHEMDLPAVGGPDCEGWSITYGCKNCDYTETLVVPATGHAYGKDGVCTKCGESTVELVISVGNASAKPGETFEVEVMLDHNTGFTWLELVPEFDPDVLELISVENGNISNLSSNGEIYVWSSASNATATGKLCTLVFAVREDAAVSKTAVSVSVSMCNSAGGMFCAVAVNDGVISANSFVYGDVNGDGKITGTDVTRLLRYIANRNPVTGESSVEIGEGSDCNGDGKITGTDVTRLLRYIANRNPVTGESSVTLGPST